MSYKFEIKDNYIILPNKTSEVVLTSIGDIHVSDSFDESKFDVIKEVINEKTDYLCLVGDTIDVLILLGQIKNKTNIFKFFKRFR